MQLDYLILLKAALYVKWRFDAHRSRINNTEEEADKY